jgi:hypothetical protein
MSAPANAPDMLRDLRFLVSDPDVSAAAKCEAIGIAYEIGKSEGRVEGAQSIGRAWTESIDRAFAPKVPA